jgi:hypothetical protein
MAQWKWAKYEKELQYKNSGKSFIKCDHFETFKWLFLNQDES